MTYLRIVEIEWEDSSTHHRWHSDKTVHVTSPCKTVGYVVRDDKEAMSLAESIDASPPLKDTIISDFGCVTTIPRSAIHKVTELSRKRS